MWHHLIWATAVVDESGDPIDASVTDGAVGWPVHEVGRNADIFDDNAGRLLKAGSSIVYQSAHLHAGGLDVKSKLMFGFRFHPVGYKPARRTTLHNLANALDIDIKPGEANQQLHAYEVLSQPAKIVTFEPHLHAPGQRMCLEAIWGYNIQTLTCAGYDHNWVRQYEYDDDHAPILPRGTILHIIGYMDNTPNNKNIPDPRNWQGSGNRSIANMFIDLGQIMPLTDAEFQAEMAKRREKLGPNRPDVIVGCPLCNVVPPPATPARDRKAWTTATAMKRIVFTMLIRGARLSNGEHPDVVLLARPERLAGLRRLGEERRWLVQHDVRLHESQLGGGS